MGKGKFFLLVLLVAAIGAGIYLYPVWKAAKTVEERVDAGGSAYEIEVALDKGGLSEQQNKIFGTLAELTGLEEASVYHFTVKGCTWEGKSHLLLYPEGAAAPLIEIYAYGDSVVINESLLYGAIRNHMLDMFPLLDFVMPRQDGNLYMTLEQMEQLFDLDLSAVRSLCLFFAEKEPTALQYFAVMAFLSRQEDDEGWRMERKTERVQLRFDVPDEAMLPAVAEIHIKEPAKALSKVGKLLPKLGIRIPEGLLQVLESLSVTWLPGQGEVVEAPADFVTQGTLDMIAEIREWMKKLSGGGSILDMIW